MDEQLKSLTGKISELIKLCEQLDRENRMLKAQNDQWASEREVLINQTGMARDKVEGMIQRLRSLEQES